MVIGPPPFLLSPEHLVHVGSPPLSHLHRGHTCLPPNRPTQYRDNLRHKCCRDSLALCNIPCCCKVFGLISQVQKNRHRIFGFFGNLHIVCDPCLSALASRKSRPASLPALSSTCQLQIKLRGYPQNTTFVTIITFWLPTVNHSHGRDTQVTASFL